MPHLFAAALQSIALLLLMSADQALAGTSDVAARDPSIRMSVDGLPVPALGVTGSPLIAATLPPELHLHGFEATRLFVTVSREGGGPIDATGAETWAGNTSVGGGGPAVKCGAALLPGASFVATALWQDAAGKQHPAGEGSFDTGLLSEADWRGAPWMGAGHGEFAATFTLAEGTATRGRAYVAAPGGQLLYVNGALVGTDSIGVAPWLDWTKQMHSRTYDVSAELRSGVNTLVLKAGCGAWCPSAAPTWAHSGRMIHTPAGKQPLARLLLTVGRRGSHAGEALQIVAGFSHSRVGTTLSSSSWFGSTINHSVPATSGWETPAREVPADTVSKDIAPITVPLVQPQVFTAKAAPSRVRSDVHYYPEDPYTEAVYPKSVEKIDATTWLYYFDEMIVGTASVAGKSWSGTGHIVLEYCEVLLHAENATCLRQSGFEETGTVDRHIVDDSIASEEGNDLHTAFSWRGFRYVKVRTSGRGITFNGAREGIYGRWSYVNIGETAHIEFGGGEEGASEMLTDIVAMVKRTQRSNLVSGLPTDCPTREKHGWLGDAMATGEEAMLNFNTRTVHGLFLDTIADAQAAGAPAVDGFVPVVVPCHQGVDAASNDLSWTSGFVMIARWLRLYYGDEDTVAKHWTQLKRWTDGQLRNASRESSDGLPDFNTYGDLAGFGIGGARAGQAKYVASAAAAANFITALQAMVEMAPVATVVSPDAADDAERWNATLAALREAFARRYWDSTTGSFCNDTTGMQTINSLALSAGVGTPVQRASAGKAVIADVVGRGYALSVGAVGARVLLDTLSDLGAEGHDAALRVVLRPEFPGWGYMVASNASTCWEGWDNETSPLYKTRGSHYHGSHNHAWLCGGVGAWVYSRLGGIRPTGDGYETVAIAPKVSKTLGPGVVSTRLATPRGLIWSNWTRALTHPAHTKQPTLVVTMRIALPASTLGTITIPAIANPDSMTVKIDDAVVWLRGEDLPADAVAKRRAAAVKRCSVVEGEVALQGVGPGTYTVVATASLKK